MTEMKLLREHRTPAGPMTAPGAVVLRDKGQGQHDRYVTHWRNDERPNEPHYVTGHYFDDLLEAEIDFQQRCERGF